MSASGRTGPDLEARLDHLRARALAEGVVEGVGVRAAGGPVPAGARAPETRQEAGYYRLALLKPPVWRWMIPVYFFLGGLGGMAALIGAAALLRPGGSTTRIAMWAAGISALLSPVLLTWDLGRPRRFIHMLRVLKLQSPMSVGSWIVTAFGAAALPGLVLTEWSARSTAAGSTAPLLHALAAAAVVASGALGALMGTYTGALIAATAVPAWHEHRILLPFHFGASALGSGAAVIELVGGGTPALRALGWGAAAAETLVLAWLELRRHGPVDEALHRGRSGWTLRSGEALAGPLALLLRGGGAGRAAAVSFLLGALAVRFGWVSAGRSCATSPAAVLAEQGVGSEARHA